MFKVYIILLYRILNTKMAPSTTHRPPSTKKIFGVWSEILPKYKRIKWTPPQGLNLRNTNSKMLPKTPNENTLICELAKKTKI